MKKRIPGIFTLALLMMPVNLSPEKRQELPEKFSQWLKEEVVYIITPKEKEVFLKLETDKTRALFIQEFWKHRDPTPISERNEFREEHYRRIEYANKNLGRGTSTQGWRTDQGKIYITLGPPRQKSYFWGGVGENYPAEIWYYSGNPKLGEPSSFRLVFFKRAGVGAFELYSPISDGPRSLTPLTSMYNTGSPDHADQVAYKLLYERVSPELAYASWSSFLSSDGGTSRLNNHDRISSSIMISKVPTYPYKKVKDDYAYEFLEHKAIVDVSYSINHMENLSQVSVTQDPSGLFFVNYSIQPEMLSVEKYEDHYFTNIKNSIRVTDPQNNTIYQEERIFPIEFNQETIEKLGQRPCHIYDCFPLIPGNYTLSLLLENTATKEFTSFEKIISVPGPEDLHLSPLILTRKVNQDSSYYEFNRAYQVGKLQIYPSIRNRFFHEDTLYVYFQILGLTPELVEKGTIEFILYDEKKTIQKIPKKIPEFNKNRNFLQSFSLSAFEPGKYGVKVSLLDESQKEIHSQNQGFSISTKSLLEPWIISQTNPASSDPVYYFVLGRQLLNNGDIAKAREYLKKAYEQEPEALDYSLSYAHALLRTEEHTLAQDILIPFLEMGYDDFDLFYYLALASQGRGEWRKAIDYYQQALTHQSNVIEILNAVGTCYFQLEEFSEAERAWKKSLELRPEQEEIKQKIQALKDKK